MASLLSMYRSLLASLGVDLPTSGSTSPIRLTSSSRLLKLDSLNPTTVFAADSTAFQDIARGGGGSNGCDKVKSQSHVCDI